MFDEFQGWCILKGDESLQRAVKKQPVKRVDRYQLHTLDSAIKKTTQRRVAVDIGAHYGVMSYTLSKLFDEVHAFEIDPDVHACLQQNIKNFSMTNVIAHPFGLGDKKQQVGLKKKASKTFSTHVDLTASENLVPIRTLDSFGLKNVDLIKIDAEGFEPFIIQGGLNTIKKYKPVILYEDKGHSQRYENSYGILDSTVVFNYELQYLNDKKNKLLKVKNDNSK